MTTQLAEALPQGEPIQIVVTSANGEALVDAPLIPVERHPETLELAPPYGTAGWYAEAGWSQAKPGFPGPSIVVGHVVGPGSAPDVFARLPEARPEDVVTFRYDSGDTVQFRVTRSEAVDKDDAVNVGDENGVGATQVAKDIWMVQSDQPLIRVFTCDPGTERGNDGHLLGNWVVFGEILR